MESAKEKAIREAWIEIAGEEIKEYLNDVDCDGWLFEDCGYDWGKIADGKIIDKTVERYYYCSDKETAYLPASLKNIEFNNGWCNINENGIPLFDGLFKVGYLDGKDFLEGGEHSLYELQRLKDIKLITHFRKVESLPKPIY